MTHVQKETAVLLKEKGFDLPCEVYYTTDCYGKEFGKHIDYNKLPIRSGVLCSCPDIYAATEWLRAKGVHVSAFPSARAYKWQSKVEVIENGKLKFVDAVNTYFDPCDTHDLALEAGIVHALKNYVK
jgi:hypothetical protein